MYDVTHPGGWKYVVSEQSESLEFIRVFDCSGSAAKFRGTAPV